MSSGAIVKPPKMMEPQKLDFTSKWSDYRQQQPPPHGWIVTSTSCEMATSMHLVAHLSSLLLFRLLSVRMVALIWPVQ